jgi:hypothetical protein
MNAVIDRPRPRAHKFLALALGVAAFFASTVALGFWAQHSEAAPVTASAVLLEAEEAPWGSNFDEVAMEEALGSSGWERQEFATVQADSALGGLFAPKVEFIFIEASDDSTEEAKGFVEAHRAELEAFVARGGSLFINSGTNQGVTIEFEGRQTGRTNGAESDTVEVTGAAGPIFDAPFPIASTYFTGSAFAAGDVSGAAVTPLLTYAEEGPDLGDVALGIYDSGSGHVALGTMTMPEFQEPVKEAEELRIDLIAYLQHVSSAGAETIIPATSLVTPTVTATAPAPVAMCVVPKLKGKTLKGAEAALKKAHCGLDKVAHKKSVSLKTGRVIRQSPAPGTVRGAGSEASFRLGRR